MWASIARLTYFSKPQINFERELIIFPDFQKLSVNNLSKDILNEIFSEVILLMFEIILFSRGSQCFTVQYSFRVALISFSYDLNCLIFSLLKQMSSL